MQSKKSIFSSAVLLVLLLTFSTNAQYSLPDTRYQGFGFLFLGGEELSAEAISEQFSAAGYTEPAKRFITIGGGGLFFADRFIIGGEGSAIIKRNTPGPDDAISLSRSGSYGFLSVGYTLIDQTSFRVYPLLGMGAGLSEFSISNKRDITFDELLAEPGSITRLFQAHFLLNGSVGCDFPVGASSISSRNKLILGVRVGYTISLVSSSWNDENQTIDGAPDGDMSGPFIKLLIGTGR